MKRHLIAALAFAALVPLQASASCIGSEALSYCSDDKGNTYDVQRLGDTTYVQGRNSRTGSAWTQESQTIGDTTFHSGKAADGGRWNGTTTRIGDTTFHEGRDSNGKPYSKTCNQFGCY